MTSDQPKKVQALKLTWSAYPHMPMYIEKYSEVPAALEAMLGDDPDYWWPEAVGDSVTVEIVEVDEGFIASLDPWEI